MQNDTPGTESVQAEPTFEQFEAARMAGKLEPEPTADESAAAASAESQAKTEPESDPDAVEKRKQSNRDRKIDRLTREKYELRGRVAELERRLGQSGPTPADTKTPAEAKQPATDGRPTLDDVDPATGKPLYPDYDAYTDALTDWKAEQRVKQESQRTAEQTAKERGEKLINEFKADHPDFDEVMEQAPEIDLAPEVQRAIAKGGVGLLYELAKDHELALELEAMDPIDAIERIGQIKAQLKQSSTQTPTTRASKAPAPPETVGSVATSAKSITSADLPFEDFERMRNEQLKKR